MGLSEPLTTNRTLDFRGSISSAAHRGVHAEALEVEAQTPVDDLQASLKRGVARGWWQKNMKTLSGFRSGECGEREGKESPLKTNPGWRSESPLP